MKSNLFVAMLIFAALFVCGCGSSGGGSDWGGGGYWPVPPSPDPTPDPVVDEYIPFVGIVDYGKSSLIMIDRDSINENNPLSFEIPLEAGAKTVAYCHYNQFMYAGCGKYLVAVYASENYVKYMNQTDDTVFLASDFYSTLFGAYEGASDFSLLNFNDVGEVWKDKNVWVNGNPVHAAVSENGRYGAASGTCANSKGVTVYDRDTGSYWNIEEAGNRGLDITEDGVVFSVLFDGARFSLNKFSKDGALLSSVDLGKEMANPWGVAYFEYSDGSGEIFVTDYSRAGKICVYDAADLYYIGDVGGSWICPKHISGTPERTTLYVSVQGDGNGYGASLLQIDPSRDLDAAVISNVNLGGVGGRVLEGLTVMPYSEDWR